MTATEAVPWLSPTEMRAWRAFIEVHQDLMNALEADLAPHGLSVGDYQVLVYLSESEDQNMRMCDLAERLQLSPSGLTRRLDGLVRAGLVARNPSSQDRRVMLAVLTPAGRSTIETVAPHHVRSVRQHFVDRLSPAQLAVFADAFEAVAQGLRPVDAP